MIIHSRKRKEGIKKSLKWLIMIISAEWYYYNKDFHFLCYLLNKLMFVNY